MMAKYTVKWKDVVEIVCESDKLNDAIKMAKAELDKPGCKGTYIYKEGEQVFCRSYSSKPSSSPRMTHPKLIKDENGCICADWQPRKNQTRNTSARYNFDTGVLVIAGKTVEKHPKFKNIDKFEHWVSTYFAQGKDGYDPDERQ